MEDNVKICREAMFEIWNADYSQYAGEKANFQTIAIIRKQSVLVMIN